MTDRAALAATVVLLAVPSAAEADGPRCFGERATLVYGGHDGYAPGTGRDDVIVVRGFVVATEGRGGDDLICVRHGGPVPLIDGGPGDDVIDAGPNGAFVGGGGGDDAVHAGPGGDYIYGDRGADRYWGGRGDDTVDFGNAEGRIRADLDRGAAIYGRHVQSLAGIESIWGSRFSDTLVGDDEGNYLAGNGGADVLVGLHGHDRLYGFRGDDVANGGGSRDRCDAEEMSSCERRFPPLPPPIAIDD